MKNETIKMTTAKSIETFFQIGDCNLIAGMRAASRGVFPQTVKAFDGLTASDMTTIKTNGIGALAGPAKDAIKAAMIADNFSFLMSDK